MADRFSVRTTPRFDRLAKALRRRDQEFTAQYREAIVILTDDPYNRSRSHRIKKLVDVKPGEGQWRLRLGRWRFRYDIEGSDVVLTSAAGATRALTARLPGLGPSSAAIGRFLTNESWQNLPQPKSESVAKAPGV